MARRRYISTDISLDARINALATESDFAALLYTWLIPHCEDTAMIPKSEVAELVMLVMPGRRDKSLADFEDALKLIESHGLILWTTTGVWFPYEAFYDYQTYIKAEKRRTSPPPDSLKPSDTKGAPNTAKHRSTPTNAEEHEGTAQNTVSPSPSPSPSRNSGERRTPTQTEHDSIVAALIAEHGEPATEREWGKYHDTAKRLRDGQVTPAEYPRLVDAFRLKHGEGVSFGVATVSNRIGELRHHLAKAAKSREPVVVDPESCRHPVVGSVDGVQICAACGTELEDGAA